MKKSLNLLYLLLMGLFMVSTTACESSLVSAQDESESDGQTEIVAALGRDLALSNSDTQLLRRIIASHREKGAGFLWYVAADLQELLSDQQKQRLFRLAASGPPVGMHAAAGERAAMTPEQRRVAETVRQQLQELARARRAGRITQEEFEERTNALRTRFQAFMQGQQPAQHPMIDALGLSEEQVASLRRFTSAHQERMRAFRAQLEPGQMDREAMSAMMARFNASYYAGLATFLSEKQVEIVKIHDALVIRLGAGASPRPQQRPDPGRG